MQRKMDQIKDQLNFDLIHGLILLYATRPRCSCSRVLQWPMRAQRALGRYSPSVLDVWRVLRFQYR